MAPVTLNQWERQLEKNLINLRRVHHFLFSFSPFDFSVPRGFFLSAIIQERFSPSFAFFDAPWQFWRWSFLTLGIIQIKDIKNIEMISQH
ncbi:hypothetical protein NPIL_394031 [Nephila pilipes]|uniref:Uncharacterized protein n=1 Tax=Nephila pilipes TaxID=299642 RepID=A0A8X6QH68_NEPPI|nr:hypothetical protein NPIL_394031 [Nephila pilipes]